jgi:hypothetical protein
MTAQGSNDTVDDGTLEIYGRKPINRREYCQNLPKLLEIAPILSVPR